MQKNEQFLDPWDTNITYNFWASRRKREEGSERIFISRNNGSNSSNLMRKLMYTAKKLNKLQER